LNEEVDDEVFGPKKKLENTSVVNLDFATLSAIRAEFEDTGIRIKTNEIIKNLKLPSDSSEAPYVEYPEAVAMMRNIDKAETSSEVRAAYCCLFQYFTGLRYGELFQVEEANISTKMIDGTPVKMLHYTSDKTGKENEVPLPNACLTIIDFFKKNKFPSPIMMKKEATKLPGMRKAINLYLQGRPIPEKFRDLIIVRDKCLLPVLASSTLSVGVKKFLKRIDLFHKTTKRVRYRGTERIEEHIPRWDILSSHSFRHGYSHYLSLNGIHIDDIGELLNHSDSATTKRHYKHIEKDRITLQAVMALNKAG
jgi:integrase